MRNIIAALLVCGAAVPAFAQDVSGARDASGKFTAALSSGDAQAAAAYLTDDAVALPPGRAPINGKAEIQRFLGNMTHAVKNLKYTSEDVKAIDDNTVREVGTFAFKMRDKDIDGKYLLVWTKVGSDWKVAADMWNRSSTGGGKAGRGGRQGGGAGKGGDDAE
ncbi:YybH family protein [Lichenibacterium minor]|nr:DUF4440 domain-containing protein [Lichenibacterium minor]